LEGKLVYESGIIGATGKAEHQDLQKGHIGQRFVETYIPISNPGTNVVVGAVELYKLPRALQRAVTNGQRLIWLGALIGSVLLFTSLYWIVRRADRVMTAQNQRLLESESLSMIGETASAVAHAMRNPLASIRASAELSLVDDLDGARESAQDIIEEADRLDRWARELLQFSRSDSGEAESVEVNALARAVIEEHTAAMERCGVSCRLELAETPLYARAGTAPLAQVLCNLVMNAIEAMEAKGTLTVTSACREHDQRV